MKISREINGVMCDIELTHDELISAYFEQQYRFDVESCHDYFEYNYHDASWYGSMNAEKRDVLIAKAASELRRNIDKYDMTFDYAMSDAFETTIDRILN